MKGEHKISLQLRENILVWKTHIILIYFILFHPNVSGEILKSFCFAGLLETTEIIANYKCTLFSQKWKHIADKIQTPGLQRSALNSYQIVNFMQVRLYIFTAVSNSLHGVWGKISLKNTVKEAMKSIPFIL